MEGLVIKSTGSWYKVKTDEGGLYDCKIKGRFRIDNLKSTNPIAVGDLVSFDPEEETTGVIDRIHDRKNYIVRKATNLSKQSHIVAANLDRAYLIVTIRRPKTFSLFIDRFLVTAEAYNVPATIVFNKIDIYKKKDLEQLAEWKAVYNAAGYNVLETSSLTGQNIDVLSEQMQGKVNLFVGNSGVGKSSLINAIDNSLDLKTASVSESSKKGQHTTTFAEMFEMKGGGYVIDSPGLKSFGLLDMEKWEISHYFPEMFKRLTNCRYHNCTHVHEPGCAVVKAVEEGEIALFRYENYLSLMDDENDKYRKAY